MNKAIIAAGALAVVAILGYASYELAWAGPSWRDACVARKGIPIHWPSRLCVKRDAIIQVTK